MTGKFFASSLLLASMLTTPALAAEPPAAWPRLVTVDATIAYGDLDLGTPAGLAEFQRRAREAAMAMCRPDPVPGGLGRGRLDGHCFREAMANARAQVGQVIAARNGTVRTALNASPNADRDD